MATLLSIAVVGVCGLCESNCLTVGSDEDAVGSPMQGGQQDSAATHIAGNQGPHTTVPLSALPLFRRTLYTVNADYYSQGTHHYHPCFMCTTKQSMQIIYPHKVSWIGRFRMFVQLGHWKLAREVLDAAVWNQMDIHSGCTTWKPTGAMVSRCFQTVCCCSLGDHCFFLSFWGLPLTDCWLNISHMSQLFPERSDITNVACPLVAQWTKLTWMDIIYAVEAVRMSVCLPKQISVIRASSLNLCTNFAQTQQCLLSPFLCSSMFMCCI